MNDKKYYWIKLKTDFFDLPTIDWLMEQKNGSDYVILYQKLCLLTANNNGELTRTIGEMIIPYDFEKISQMTKFDIDTVTVGMELFKRLGLIYEQDETILRISAIEEMIGSESKWAKYKRNERLEIVQPKSNKSIDIEKDIDIDNIKEKIYKKEKFKKPTLEEVEKYCKERNNKIDCQYFIDYYEANGWKIGKNAMKDWKAAIRTWEKNNYKKDYQQKHIDPVPDWMNKDIETKAVNKAKLLQLEKEMADYR